MAKIDLASNTALKAVDSALQKQNFFLSEISAVATAGIPKTWSEVQGVVRAGVAHKVFSIGDSLYCMHERYGMLRWDVIGFDIDTPADSGKRHTMTLMLHSAPLQLEADAPEALFVAERELVPGTYHHNIEGEDMCFTLTKPVPKGGIIEMAWRQGFYNFRTLSTYEGSESTVPYEVVQATVGKFGVSLLEFGVHNDFVRGGMGCGRYIHSAVRQFLNSEQAAGNVWKPQTKFDRPPLWANEKSGFLSGIDRDFLSVIGRSKKDVIRCSYDGGGKDIFSDKMFLLSKTEVCALPEDGEAEGSAYPYFEIFSDMQPHDNEDSKRRKFYDGASALWWLRTPVRENTAKMFAVSKRGAPVADFAARQLAVCPACCVI